VARDWPIGTALDENTQTSNTKGNKGHYGKGPSGKAAEAYQRQGSEGPHSNKFPVGKME
jgi:hypothetical protein